MRILEVAMPSSRALTTGSAPATGEDQSPADALAEVRRRAVAATRSGVTQVDVARIFGVSRQTVARWVRTYREGGEEMLSSQRRGRRPGEQLAMTYSQQVWVLTALAAHSPDQLGLRYRLWTRQALVELINRELGVALSVTSIRNYLIRWGLLDEQSLLHTLRGEHAMLATETAADLTVWITGAETLWADWIRIRAAAPAAVTSTSAPAYREAAMFRAVSNRGAVHFVARTDPFDGRQVCDFLDRLRGQLNRKINVVLRWRPRHHTEDMCDWQASRKGEVTVRFGGGR
jgi:transposase